MREAFAGLGIEGRIGVSTGEVVTGTEERLATGDALNVAARLQQAAAPGEVLIAEATRRAGRRRGRRGAGRAAGVEGEERAGARLPAARVPARRPSGGTTRCSSAASASWRCWARPGGGLWRSGAASWSRSSVTRVLASRGWRRRRSPRSRRGSFAAAAFPTGSGSPTGRSWRCVKQLDALPVRSGRRGGDPLAARRVGGGHVGGGDRLGVPQAARGAGAARRRVRRHPVGRGDVPRPGRACRAALQRRPAPARLHGPPGAARQPPLLAGDGAARAARAARMRPA